MYCEVADSSKAQLDIDFTSKFVEFDISHKRRDNSTKMVELKTALASKV